MRMHGWVGGGQARRWAWFNTKERQQLGWWLSSWVGHSDFSPLWQLLLVGTALDPPSRTVEWPCPMEQQLMHGKSQAQC